MSKSGNQFVSEPDAPAGESGEAAGSTKMGWRKAVLDAEEKANVYGFNRKLLGSPTSVEMMNCYAIKKTDKEKME